MIAVPRSVTLSLRRVPVRRSTGTKATCAVRDVGRSMPSLARYESFFNRCVGRYMGTLLAGGGQVVGRWWASGRQVCRQRRSIGGRERSSNEAAGFTVRGPAFCPRPRPARRPEGGIAPGARTTAGGAEDCSYAGGPLRACPRSQGLGRSPVSSPRKATPSPPVKLPTDDSFGHVKRAQTSRPVVPHWNARRWLHHRLARGVWSIRSVGEVFQNRLAIASVP